MGAAKHLMVPGFFYVFIHVQKENFLQKGKVFHRF